MSGDRVVDPWGRDRPSARPFAPLTPSSLAYATSQHGHSHANIDGQIHSSPSVPYVPRPVVERSFGAHNFDSVVGRSGLPQPKRSVSPPKRNAPPFQYKDLPRGNSHHLLTPGPEPFLSPFPSSPAQRPLLPHLVRFPSPSASLPGEEPYPRRLVRHPSPLAPSPGQESYPRPKPLFANPLASSPGQELYSQPKAPFANPIASSPGQGLRPRPGYIVQELEFPEYWPSPSVQNDSGNLSSEARFLSPCPPPGPPRSPTTYDFSWLDPSNSLPSNQGDSLKAAVSSPRSAKKESLFSRVKKKFNRCRLSPRSSPKLTLRGRILLDSECNPSISHVQVPLQEDVLGIRPSSSVFGADIEREDQALLHCQDNSVVEATRQSESPVREFFRRPRDSHGGSFRTENSYSLGKRQLRQNSFRSRDVTGAQSVDRFLAGGREPDKVRSIRSRVTPQRTVSGARQRQEARRRLIGAAAHELPVVRRDKLSDDVLGEVRPLESQRWGSTPRRESRSDFVGRVDRQSDLSLVAHPKRLPKSSGETHARTLHQFSSQLRDREIVICTRSKTGTVKELPVTPANKRIIKAVLQEAESDHTDSVYSDTNQNSTRTSFSDLKPSPLYLKEKTPSPLSSAKSSQTLVPSYEVDPFRTANAFLDSCLSAQEDHPLPKMDTLQVSSANRSSAKAKAEEDARVMQKTVIESCKKAGRDPPKYVLMELIGKGSFGRVYKGKDINTTNVVAVKIIDIDESDTVNPRLADTYSEFMKEVNALKILSASKAKNINHVIEALPVGTAMWMITEYCGGGSIATLMKPTPDGLKEKFIIPILREVAEAVKWVHQAGIIHRDLKCANILITEEGGVQLCDFGVAGITETAVDKRSTFIGTFHWMAPELFRGSSYGTEVDIWAFGSMTYEMATGLPPNAMSGLNGRELGDLLQTHIPRLQGDEYSEGLKNIVAFCMEENPSDRPNIEAVQRHPYIYNSSSKYPSSGLSDLVKAFKMWESHGGSRKSLFGAGGAQGPSELSSTAHSDDSWNFSTTPAFDLAVAEATDPQDIINVYGASATLGTDFADDTSRPIRQQGRANRRRPPPEALAPLKAPLEKLFDPNTMSNYKDNAISHFNLQPNAASDLPLRDDSEHVSIRDTLIDLDAHDIPSGLSSFAEGDTMKPARRAAQVDSEEGYESGRGHDFSRPALSDPVDNPNRRTQDWKFPTMAPPASANPEFSRFPVLQRPNVTPGSGARPALMHHPTEPATLPTQGHYGLAPPASSADRMSLIDLDMSIPEPSRPSTADSSASQENASANPFIWERHASIYHGQDPRSAREPSLYLEDPSGLHMQASNNLQDLAEVSDFSASDAEGYPEEQYNGSRQRPEGRRNDGSFDRPAAGEMQADYNFDSSRGRALYEAMTGFAPQYSTAFHPLPPPPSAAVLSGTASYDELRSESHRMFETLKSSLETFRAAYENMPTRPAKGNQGTSGDDSQGGSSSHETGFNIS